MPGSRHIKYREPDKKKVALSMIGDLSHPDSQSKLDDELRRIEDAINAQSEPDTKGATGDSAKPTTSTPKDKPADKPKTPPGNPLLVTQHNASTVVPATTILDFQDNASITFRVTQPIGGKAKVEAIANNPAELTLYHDRVAVLSRTPNIYNTVKHISFADTTGNGGIAWTVVNYRRDGIEVSGRVTVCVYGENIGTLPAVPPDKSWYVDTIEDPETHCKILRFKKFRVANDLIVTEGTNAYLFDVNILGTNVGDPTGEGVYFSKTASTLGFRRIVGLAGITVGSATYADNNDTITITCSYTGVNLGISAAGNAEVFKEISGNEWRFRRLQAGTNVTITQGSDYIVIGLAGVLTDVDGSNVGGGLYVYKDTVTSGSTRTLRHRSLLTAGDLYGVENTNDITLKLQYVGNNLPGGDVVLYRGKTSTVSGEQVLNFRMLKAGTGIDFAGTTSDYVVINAIGGGGGVYTFSNLGTAGTGKAEVLSGVVGSDVQFRRLLAGLGVTITEDSNYITIATGIVNADGQNEGGQTYEWYINTTVDVGGTHTLHFRSFGTAHDATIVDYGDYYIFDVNITGNNVGTGVGIFRDKTSGVGAQRFLNFYSLVGVGGTSVTLVGNTIEIESDVQTVHEMDNVGGFSEVYKNYTDAAGTRTFHLRTLHSSNYTLSVIQGTDDIDLKVNDLYSVKSLVELAGTPDSYTTVSNPMRELRFSHYFNRPGFTVAPNDFDNTWLVMETPSTGRTRAKLQIPNPLQAEHRDIGGSVVNTTNVGIRKFIFKDNSQITFSVAEGTNADGYREATVMASFTNPDVVERIYDIDNIGGFREVYKNYTDAGSTRTFHLRTLQSSDGSITITQNSDNVDFKSNTLNYAVDNVGGFNEVYKNYTDASGTRTFHLRTLQSSDGSITITQNANDIDFIAPDTYDLSVGYGGATGATLNFAGATMGEVNHADTHLLWFAGDNASFEGGGGALGLHGDRPTFDVVFIVDNNDAPWVVGNPYYGLSQTTRIKARVTPLLYAWDTYTQDTLLINTTDHLTRMEFVDTATTQVRVSPHGTYTHGVKIETTVKEGTSVQRVRVRHNNTTPVYTRPQLNFDDSDYLTFTVSDDAGNNEVDITAVPLNGLKINSGALRLRRDIDFVAGYGVTLTEDTSDAYIYKLTIDRPLTVMDDGVAVVSNVTKTINFNDSANDIKMLVALDADPTRANVSAQLCGYGTKWDTPLFCDPGGVVDYITSFANNTWSYQLWFDSELTEDTQGWVDNPTTPSPRWQFKPNRKGRYHVHVFVRFRSADPTNNSTPQAMDLPQLAVFKNGVLDTMLDVDELSVRYNELQRYAVNSAGWAEGEIHPSHVYSLHGGTTMQLEANEYIDFRLAHQSAENKYIQLLYGWTSIDYVGRCNDTVNAPTIAIFDDI